MMIIDIAFAVNHYDEVVRLVFGLEQLGFMYCQYNMAGDMLFICKDEAVGKPITED